MIINEFKKHNISIPFPIKTEYRGDLEQELKKLKDTEPVRKKTQKEYGVGDLNDLDFSESDDN